MRCGRCGNENDETNRFCGMCGTPLVATPLPGGQSAASPANTVASRTSSVPVKPVPAQPAPGQSEAAALSESARFRTTNVEPRQAPLRSEVRPSEVRPSEVRASEVRPNPGPVITGHSFLGLSSPGPAVDRHDERDPLRPSSNLDYLLDDEEEPKRGWGKLVLIVVALALAVGLGYLHFKQTGFGELTGSDKKPAAAKPAAEAADSGGAAGPTTPDGTAPAGAGGTGTVPATGIAANPGDASGAAAASSQTPSQINPQTTAAPGTPSQPTPSQAQPGDPNLPAASAPPTASSSPGKQTPPAEPPREPKAARKPSAATKPVDPVTYAERYIYGRGVRQDCDHGLRLLKAAEPSNAKAMISLGALYSTGTCTPRDLPTAYRWFALALHQEPDNQALQDDLQKLWSQMTQPERQLAIKLSQ